MTLLEPSIGTIRKRPFGQLYGYILFHLNLMFSSIEEEQRPDVVAQCYEPLLDIAEDGIAIGIEASGLTLEIIRDIAPLWLDRLRRLVEAGQVEFIGSGYAQAIGPLMPWRAVAKNLELGQAVYRDLLGVEPAIALINEQAYSSGLVPLYREAGYAAVIMDWDDAAAHHPEWNRSWRYHPQRARGAYGSDIGLLWSNTIAFQKLQRLAHGDIGLDDYTDYVIAHRGPVDRVIALYANDAECFNFRPGRFETEDALREDEWVVVRNAFNAAQASGAKIVLPSAALSAAQGPNADNQLSLEASTNPIPVKKQPKYNITRWASSGRDDLWANSQCHRAFQAIEKKCPDDDEAWRTLCRLWSSDFRTHITPRRWAKFRDELTGFVDSIETTPIDYPAPTLLRNASTTPKVERSKRHILIETSALRVAFDLRRGLAVAAMGRSNERALIGGLPLGTIDDIALSPDWYTANSVFEGPGEAKVTDLEWCEPSLAIEPETNIVRLRTTIATRLGPIDKLIEIAPDEPRIACSVTFRWPLWGKGSLRLGHVTLVPGAFQAEGLVYTTHNGGRVPERFSFSHQPVDLGAPVSFLISCRSGVGMTEGWLQIDDGRNAVRLESDLAAAATIGLVEHRLVNGQTFCRMMLSALELDETRRVPDEPSPPRTVRFAIALSRVNAC